MLVQLFVLLLLQWLPAAAKRRIGKDWSKMSDDDWDRLDEQWETPEEAEEYAFRPPKEGAGGGIDLASLKGKDPKAIEELVGDAQVQPGPTMMFATVDYNGCCTKPRSEALAKKWSGLLSSGGMDVQAYVVRNDALLFATQVGRHAREIKEFVLEQPECVALEWNQKRIPGPAETEDWKARDAAAKADRDAQMGREAPDVRKKPAKKKKRGKGKGAPKEKDEM